jgi:phenylalanyl-tRNA synthetase beta subunit
MDILNKIEELVEKIKSDKTLASRFAKEPVKTVEDLLGVDLPDEQIKELVEKVKARVEKEGIGEKLDNLGDKLSDIGDTLGGKINDLLGKK